MFAVLIGTVGCSHLSYLWQAARGQAELYNKQQPIEDVLQDSTVDENIKKELRSVGEIKKFVESELGVIPTKNYTTYVDLKRPYVVWVVSAAQPYELQLKTWSFPIAGEVPYLGFFKEEDARAKAQSLAQDGFDIYVRGAEAYSTLGYFKDPLLSSMLHNQEGDLANLIFHETTHAYVYVKDESSFNEAAASFIGDYGERIFLTKKYGPQSEQVKKWKIEREDRRRFGTVLKNFEEQLRTLYATHKGDGVAKAQKFLDFQKQFLKIHWQSKRYQRWVSRIKNNAVILALLTYDDEQWLFDRVFDKCGQSLKRAFAFLRTYAEEASKQSKEQRSFEKFAKEKNCAP